MQKKKKKKRAVQRIANLVVIEKNNDYLGGSDAEENELSKVWSFGCIYGITVGTTNFSTKAATAEVKDTGDVVPATAGKAVSSAEAGSINAIIAAKEAERAAKLAKLTADVNAKIAQNKEKVEAREAERAAERAAAKKAEMAAWREVINARLAKQPVFAFGEATLSEVTSS